MARRFCRVFAFGTVFAKWFGVMGKVESMRDKKTGLVDDLNDLKAFAEAMRPGELTVISGASGVGKTTLSLRIAQELVGSDEANEEANAKRVLVFRRNIPRPPLSKRGFVVAGSISTTTTVLM